jgi:hypothetical protein
MHNANKRLDTALLSVGKDVAKDYLTILRGNPGQRISATHLRFKYAVQAPDRDDLQTFLEDSPAGWQYWFGDARPSADYDECTLRQCLERKNKLQSALIAGKIHTGAELQIAKAEIAFIETYLSQTHRNRNFEIEVNSRLKEDYRYLKITFNRLHAKLQKVDEQAARYLSSRLISGMCFCWAEDISEWNTGEIS